MEKKYFVSENFKVELTTILKLRAIKMQEKITNDAQDANFLKVP